MNSQPVKAEMSIATPKSQAKEPIQFDIILVCRKRSGVVQSAASTIPEALTSARQKAVRLQQAGFSLSRNDRRIVLFGQLLTLLRSPADFASLAAQVDDALDTLAPNAPAKRHSPPQKLLFD